MKKLLVIAVILALLLSFIITVQAQNIDAILGGNNFSVGYYIINSDGDTLFTCNGDGFVGIGTANPVNYLSVFAPSGGDGLSLVNSSDETRILMSIAGGDWGFLELGDGNSGNNVVITPSGSYFNNSDYKMGIGTGTPTANLHVTGNGGVLFTGTAGSGTIPAEGAGTRMMWYPGKGAFRAGNVSAFDPTTWDDGNIGFWSVATGWGTQAAGAHSFAAGVQAHANHSGTFVWNDNATTGDDIFASTADNQFLIRARGGVGIGTNRPNAELDVVGRTRTTTLEITGGGDLAEPFDIIDPETIKPGMVVAIDPEHPGQLRIADKAYDRTVAGCVSGANGINPGLTMQQAGTKADGSFPVALAGRVYCRADASFNPIQPGDLLTTSDNPGYAMKVTDYVRAQGAILGKAMSSLEHGQGLVLILVALQ